MKSKRRWLLTGSLLAVIIILSTVLWLKMRKELEDPYFFLESKIPYSQPFALHKAGEKAVLDFWVVPNKKLDMNFSLSLGLSFRFKLDQDPRDMVLKTPISVKIKLFLVKNQELIDVPFKGATKFRDFSPDSVLKNDDSVFASGHSFWYPDEKDRNIGEKDYTLATFPLPQYGNYRIEVTSINDLPSFKEIQFLLFVSQLRYGK